MTELIVKSILLGLIAALRPVLIPVLLAILANKAHGRRRGLAGFIDAGGNQYLLGAPPGKPHWTVGVKDPDTPDRLLGAIQTTETSISTSADTSYFLTINGRRYGHILDPRSLKPSTARLASNSPATPTSS